MSFQKEVRFDQAFGVPGEIIFDGPTRATPYSIDPAAVAANVQVARFFTLNRASGYAAPGGNLDADPATVVIAGILSSPKQYALTGVAGDPLAPSMLVEPGTTAEFLSMGMICVQSKSACKPGDYVIYNTTTGELDTMDVDAAAPPAGWAPVPNALVHRSQTGATGGLVVAKLTN